MRLMSYLNIVITEALHWKECIQTSYYFIRGVFVEKGLTASKIREPQTMGLLSEVWVWPGGA